MAPASWFFGPRRKRSSMRGGYEGIDVVAGGREYRGGYVHGPLSAEEIVAITAAGHGERIVEADQPPTKHPDDDL